MESGRAVLAFDPTQLSEGDGLPQNGHDYLKLVQAERQKYPSYSFDSSSSEEDEDNYDEEVSGEDDDDEEELENKEEEEEKKLENTPVSLRLIEQSDLELSSEILENFLNLRKKIETYRESIPTQAKICDNGRQRGKSTLLKLMELGHSPQLSTIIDKSQLELHQTLENLADQCEIIPYSPIIHTDWIYSIMAALWEPLERDIYSTLRRITKICISRRFYLEWKEELDDADEEEEYASCLLIICIVRFYFGQTDLK